MALDCGGFLFFPIQRQLYFGDGGIIGSALIGCFWKQGDGLELSPLVFCLPRSSASSSLFTPLPQHTHFYITHRTHAQTNFYHHHISNLTQWPRARKVSRRVCFLFLLLDCREWRTSIRTSKSLSHGFQRQQKTMRALGDDCAASGRPQCP